MCYSSHQMSAPGGSQVNKFQQVSSLSHHLSLVGEGGPYTVRSHVQMVQGHEGSLYSEDQYIMGNGHMRNPPPQLWWGVASRPT